jgi:hypothetical protein
MRLHARSPAKIKLTRDIPNKGHIASEIYDTKKIWQKASSKRLNFDKIGRYMPQTDKNANLTAIQSPNYDLRSMDSAVEYPSHHRPVTETGTDHAAGVHHHAKIRSPAALNRSHPSEAGAQQRQEIVFQRL